MKRTGNQKVVTAAIQKHSSKALSAPYRACTILPDKKLLSMPLQSKIGACGVLLLGLPISNRDITARGYPVISGWGLIRSPSGSNLLPDRWAQDCAGYPAAMPGIFYLSGKNRHFSRNNAGFSRSYCYSLRGNVHLLLAYFFLHKWHFCRHYFNFCIQKSRSCSFFMLHFMHFAGSRIAQEVQKAYCL